MGDLSLSQDMAEAPDATLEAWRCTYYLPKKKRCCRLHRLSGSVFCAEHLPSSTVLNIGSAITKKEKVLERQPCPLDPNHTVAISRLEKHLKKCNSRPPSEDYYKPSANTNEKDEEIPLLNILTISQEEKTELILKLIKYHQKNVPPILNHFGIHEALMADFVRSDVGESAIRHSSQIGSIAKLIVDHGLLKDSTCFIEFGSGRGGLSFGLARVVKDLGMKNCKFILIDRTSPRYKKDNRAKNSEYSSVLIERIKINIEDLLVSKLPDIQNYDNIVGITKHLCGAGTDVAIRSLLDESSNSERSKVRGLVFATCCHHRVEYEDLAGKDLLTSDFSGGNFQALRQIAAWATNGDYHSTYLRDISKVSEDTLRFLNAIDVERYTDIKLKKTIGRLVKEIIDFCRAEHVQKQCISIGLKSKLVNYVDTITTRENIAIILYPQK